MNCSPANLASQAACYKSCLSPGSIAAIKNYLFCAIVKVGGIGANLIPTGASYSGGGTYTLTISANTTYGITWGANDTSATVGGTSYPNTGAGTQTDFYSASNTTITFTGTGGSTVTAMLRVAPKAVPILTGLASTLSTNGHIVTVTWDTPPSQITATNVYTSPDQVTWTLAATVNAPGASTVLAAPAVGSVLYVRAYWTSGIATNTLSPLTTNQPDAAVANWAVRVVANGGATVATSTVSALNTFIASCKGAGLWSLMYHVNCIVPDSLKAALTPLLVGGYNDPWIDNSAGSASITVNGLFTDGNQGKYFSPGNIASNLTLSSGGITTYAQRIQDPGTGSRDLGFHNTAFTDACLLNISNVGNTQGGIGQNATPNGGVSVAYPGQGYFAVNRTSTTRCDLYWANSTHAHASVASNTNLVTTLTANSPFSVCGNYNITLPAEETYQGSSRLSFLATHQGLSAAQSLSFYNAVQAMRVALGGGFA